MDAPPNKPAVSRIVAVSEFKAHCLELVESVRTRGEELVITKHGEPVARLTPMGSPTRTSLRGRLQGQIKIHDDVVHADLNQWR